MNTHLIIDRAMRTRCWEISSLRNKMWKLSCKRCICVRLI